MRFNLCSPSCRSSSVKFNYDLSKGLTPEVMAEISKKIQEAITRELAKDKNGKKPDRSNN